jgi:hypothetical protein
MRVDNVIICDKCHTKQPITAIKCCNCGASFGSIKPFHILHPEYHLRPLSEYTNLSFVFRKPDYVEDPKASSDQEYLYIVRNGKLGILYWLYEKHWYGDTNIHKRIIPCEYDDIKKLDGMFECHKNGDVIYIDKKGNILK